MTFLGYLWGIIASPLATVKRFAREKKRMRYGLLAMVVFSLLYSLACLISYLRGIAPSYGWQPFLRIPLETYYLWQSIYQTPIAIVTWIAFAGVVQLLSRAFKGSGSFEDTFALLGLPIFVLIPGMFIPDIIVEYLPGCITQSELFSRFINPIRLIAASLWPFVIHVFAVREVQALPTGKALMVTAISYIPYMTLNLTYIH